MKREPFRLTTATETGARVSRPGRCLSQNKEAISRREIRIFPIGISGKVRLVYQGRDTRHVHDSISELCTLRCKITPVLLAD